MVFGIYFKMNYSKNYDIFLVQSMPYVPGWFFFLVGAGMFFPFAEQIGN